LINKYASASKTGSKLTLNEDIEETSRYTIKSYETQETAANS
jgi:hypothetical protein